MYNNLLNNTEKYQKFLKLLEKKILEKDFEKKLLEVQNMDLKYYTKKITIQELKNCILEYREKTLEEKKIKKLQILLPGNPEIVFKICLDALKNNFNIDLCIEDFCLAQNTFLVEIVKDIAKEANLKNIIILKNLLTDKEIIENCKNVDKTIIIGNSNLYNRIVDETTNVELNTYGIFEMYSDSEKFEDLKEIIYEYLMQNQFELEIYDDLEFDEAVEAINRDGYGFCSILFSEDKENIKKFENNIKSKYVISNKNPFKEIKFDLNV